jgi:hypothetical protein
MVYNHHEYRTPYQNFVENISKQKLARIFKHTSVLKRSNNSGATIVFAAGGDVVVQTVPLESSMVISNGSAMDRCRRQLQQQLASETSWLTSRH